VKKVSVAIRNTLPKIIVTACGVLMLLAFFTPYGFFAQIMKYLTSWTVIISAIATWLGFFYMAYAQWRMYDKNRTTPNLILFLTPFVFFALFMIAGTVYPGDVNSPEYLWYFNNIRLQVGSMIYAVMFFTLASSAYRTFKFASIDATALLLGGLIYTLRQIPLFQVYIPWIMGLGEWVLLVPNVGGSRGAVICAALAAMVVGLRTLGGKEATLEAS
jgi:hypothetical protein